MEKLATSAEAIIVAAVLIFMTYRVAAAYQRAKRIGTVRTGLYGAGRTVHLSSDAALFTRAMRKRLLILAVLVPVAVWHLLRALALVVSALT
jgi:hypothetical protein